MYAMAMLPMMLAAAGLLKSILPKPSTPASIPTPRKTSRTGTLRRVEILLEQAPARINMARTVR